MKLGQVMSFLDVGLVPEEFREEFQAKLAELRDAAPKVAFKDMKQGHRAGVRRAARRGLRRPSTRCRSRPPRSARSTRRACDDGRDVAVKVQYPGVDAAVRADMQNLGMILRLMKRSRRASTPRRWRTEIRARIEEELDYELEAQNQRRAGAHLPRPPVHRRARRRHELSPRARDRQRVRRGPRLRGDRSSSPRTSATASARSSSASTSAACTATASSRGDPHPGNSLLLDDGRMAFLDFGLFKRITAGGGRVRARRRQRLGIERRAGELIEHAAQRRLDRPTPSYYTEEEILEQFRRHHVVVHARRGDRARRPRSPPR